MGCSFTDLLNGDERARLCTTYGQPRAILGEGCSWEPVHCWAAWGRNSLDLQEVWAVQNSICYTPILLLSLPHQQNCKAWKQTRC
jgi:hypothetical protein